MRSVLAIFHSKMQTFAQRRAAATPKSNFKVKLFWGTLLFITFVSVLVIVPLTLAWTISALSPEARRATPGGGNISNVSVPRRAAGLSCIWRGDGGTFNWHPLLMILAFVPLMAQSVLSYRLYSRVVLAKIGQKGLKYLHMALHCVEGLLIAIALAAVFSYHQHQHYAHLASLHSWLGMMTVLAFVALFAMGVLFYMTPKTVVSDRLRRQSVHYHRLCGMALFAGACGTIFTGITEALQFDRVSYPHDIDARLGQAIGIMLPFVVLPVIFLLTKSEYRKRVDPLEKPLTAPAKNLQAGSLKGTGAISPQERRSSPSSDDHDSLLKEENAAR